MNDEKTLLEKTISDANWAYWIENAPTISDFEYDALIEKLRKIDPDNELLNSFTARSDGNKVIHSTPMLSLDKAYSLEEVLKWANKVSRNKQEQFVIMPKFDGLSGKLDHGILSSRGDGKIGQDYTDRLPLIKFLTLEKKSVLLGEMLITNEDFDTIYKNIKTKSGIPFKNQRNAAAGIIGCDEVDFYKSQGAKITFIDYDYITYPTTLANLENDWIKIVEEIQKLPYPMDGIVIKLKDNKYYESLGATEHAPRGAIAFKYTNQSKWTTLRNVSLSMGKDMIACVGEVDPIEITGTTIKHVKLQVTKPVSCDASAYLLDGSLQIGDEVCIERAGDIIPHVLESRQGQSRTRVTLEKCPFCGAPLTISDSSISCSNEFCQEKLIQKLYYGIQVLGFKGIGEKFVRNLFTELQIDSIEKIVHLSLEKLQQFSCFGPKTSENFVEQLEKIKQNATIEQVLIALDIPSLGKATAKLVLDHFSLEQIRSFQIKSEELLKIKGIGQVASVEIAQGLARNHSKISEMLDAFTFCSIENSSLAPRAERTICFTGKMSKPRKELELLAKSLGMEPVDHVDSKLSFLVCADPNSGSSKLKKAKTFGISIISENEFLKMK